MVKGGGKGGGEEIGNLSRGNARMSSCRLLERSFDGRGSFNP